MIFSSLFFLCIFLPAFLLSFYLIRIELRKWVIVIFSGLFYAWGAPIFILYLLASSILDFYFSKYFEPGQKNRKLFLWLSIILNVGLLVYFKYANFFVDNISIITSQLNLGHISFKEVILPIGISFFTFQKISYALDLYSGKNERLNSFLDYLLYIMMFPQLIAGPIVRYKDVSTQIKNYHKNRLDNKLEGLYRFIIGLGKKVILANTFAEVAEQVNSYPIEYLPFADAWLGIIAYTFQIYFDFSGYSDMAIGLGLMIGFRFPENFNFPYLSKSITEFWQRWHMTLGAWMRDYLYIPLGGNRVSKGRIYFNLIFVFFISGFWHGANWNFIVWGLFHGLFLIIERAGFSKILAKLPNAIQVLYTFIIVIFSWVFFSKDFSSAISYFERMFDFSSLTTLNSQLSNRTIFIFILGVVFAFMAINKRLMAYFNNFINKITISHKRAILYFPLLLVILIMSFFLLMTSDFNPFIYYRF